MLSILGLLDTPSSGSYALDGTEVANLSPADRARIRNRQIGFIFQSFNLIGDLTVFENVELPLTYRGMSAGERKGFVTEALERVGMAHRAKHLPSQLSGGQQQRLCIARALAVEPEVILMDEPCSALDPIATAKIEELIHELRSQYTIVIVTHNMQQAGRVSDYTAFFYMGRLIEFGSTTKIFTNPSQKQTEDYITGRFG